MNPNKIALALIVSSFLSAFYAVAASTHESNGLKEHGDWIEPIASEVLKADKWRDESDNLYLKDSGDYNGDGILDHVAVMVSKDKLEEGLLVRLGNHGKLSKWHILATNPLGKEGLAFMGVETLQPGKYQTVMCYNFDENEQCMSEITLKNDSILYFRFASSSRIFWWDGADSSFKTFWYKD